jgi:hypothetical protein
MVHPLISEQTRMSGYLEEDGDIFMRLFVFQRKVTGRILIDGVLHDIVCPIRLNDITRSSIRDTVERK